MKHFISLRALLTVFFSFAIAQVGWGQYNGTGTFTRITSVTSLTDGYYVLTRDTGTPAMNNVHDGTFLAHTAVTPVSNVITDPATSIVWRIQTNDSGRTIYNEASARYVSYSGSSNNVQVVTSVTSNNQRWNFSYADEKFSVANVALTTRLLQYNVSAPRFACYTGSQQNLALYKLTLVAPTVATTPANSVTSTTATIGGNITATGGANATIRGIEYSTTEGFSNGSGTQVTESGSFGTGSFTNSLIGLTPGTTYYYKAFATNSAGTGYGAQQSFTTLAPPSAPTITSITPGDSLLIVAFDAPASDGGAVITNYEYSTDDGAIFTANSPPSTDTSLTITGLNNGNQYDVRIRAVNAAGFGASSNLVAGTPAAPTSPVILVSGSLGEMTTVYGSASAAQTFTVSGSVLTGDLTVSAPNGFEVSTAAESGYAGSVTLEETDGSIATTTVYVRLAATSAAATYSGDVTITGGGADSVTVATVSSTVSPKTLTITGLTGESKIYDSTPAAIATGTATLNGVVNGDDTALAGVPMFTFDIATIGTDIPISVTGYTLAGTTAGNYTLVQPVGLTADITAKELTVTGASVTTKTYDGTTTAAITGAELVGVVGGDEVTLSGGGNFETANAGEEIPVTAALVLGGADSGNYTLTQPFGLAGDILKADQVITFDSLPPTPINSLDFELTAAASSGLEITYSSSNTEVATVSGSTVTLVANGTTTITASQAGNQNYNSAVDVGQILTVTTPPVLWNFTSANPSGVPANLNISVISRGNNNGTTDLLNSTSASSGYPGASGGNNVGAAARTGALNIGSSGSPYFEFTVTPDPGFSIEFSSIAFGSRSTGTGPQAYSLRSSIDEYEVDLATGSLGSNSTWTFYSNTGLALSSSTPVTYRIYGHSGNGNPGSNTANWRIDDLTLVIGAVALPTPYEQWADSFPGFTDTATTSNPDGDTLTNLMEFAFGTDPTASTSGPITYEGETITSLGLPTTSISNITNGVDFRAVFGRRKNYVAAGLTYTVQFSAGLDIWVNSTATPTVVASDETMDAVTVPYPLFIQTARGVEKPTFFRVAVSSN